MSLSDKQKEILLPYQINNAENIIRILKNNKTGLDASDTGTGKTYTAVAACKAMRKRPIVVCPKAVMANWKRVCKLFNADPFFVVNYETLKNLKYYDNGGNRIKCPYLTYDDNTKKYIWKDIPEDVVFIYDEAHKCSGLSTFNGALLLATKDTTNNNILLLSATIADHPEKFKIFFYILNFIEEAQAKQSGLDFKKYMKIVDNWIMRDNKPMARIFKMLYPNRSTKMSIDVIPDFPETQISAVPYSMGNRREGEIEAQYAIIYDELEALKDKTKKDKKNPLVRILRAQQKIELLKIPLFVDLANDFMNDGFSVVIFVNFTATLKSLSELLFTNCLIYGEQTDTDRQYNIDMFQNNKERLIIANIMAGGVGISLHDLDGRYKRASLLSPCWSATNMVQALGRIHRAGAKSKSIQRIVYVSGTAEEKICDKLQTKLKDLNSINNGDIDLTNITFERKIQQI